MCFKIAPAHLNWEEDIVVGVVYIPPENSSYFSPDSFIPLENEYIDFSRNYNFTINKIKFYGSKKIESLLVQWLNKYLDVNLCLILIIYHQQKQKSMCKF